jgi:tRNA G18 (ribose-2'-O)-methylase SpoU
MFNLKEKMYNVDLRFTGWSVDLIKKDMMSTTHPFSVLMENFAGDFNIGSVLRSANAYNAKEMFYYGNRHWDRRGSVGTHHYTNMIHLKEKDSLIDLKKKYTLVGLENNVPEAVSLYDFVWPDNPMIVVGEEGCGITPDTMRLCEKFVYIPMFGSVRSFNAAVAASIAMNDFIQKFYQKGNNNVK